MAVALAITAVGTIGFGLYPELLFDGAQAAAATFWSSAAAVALR